MKHEQIHNLTLNHALSLCAVCNRHSETNALIKWLLRKNVLYLSKIFQQIDAETKINSKLEKSKYKQLTELYEWIEDQKMQMHGSGSVGGAYPPPPPSSKATVRHSHFFKMGEDHTYWRWTPAPQIKYLWRPLHHECVWIPRLDPLCINTLH